MQEFPRPVDVYEDQLRAAQEAKQLGYRYYFVIEHQNSPVCAVTAPNIYLTALAGARSQLDAVVRTARDTGVRREMSSPQSGG